MNSLTKSTNLKYNAVPFDQISDNDFLPALKDAINQAKLKIDEIINHSEIPSFENTITPLLDCEIPMERIGLIFHCLESACSNEQIREIAKEFEPLLSEYHNDVNLNQVLFTKVKNVYDQQLQQLKSTEQRSSLEKIYLSFKKNGALLDENLKSKLRDLDSKTSMLTPLFSENILKVKSENFLHLTNPAELDGIPENLVNNAERLAQSKNLSGWAFSIQAPVIIGILKYANNESVRESIWRLNLKSNSQGTYDNSNIIKDIAIIKHQRAKLLGYNSYAHYALEERMAKSPKNVWNFLAQLLTPSRVAAEQDLKELQSYKNRLGHPQNIMPWDMEYYGRKLKEEKFTLNEEELRQFFPAQQVIEGVFLHAQKLYGLQFTPITDLPTYHQEVKVFEVKNDLGEFQGLLYLDLYNRDNKRPGAWCTRLQLQWKRNEENIRPHVVIVCNFDPPAKGEVSLLKFQEVRTLFHEFGHALHNLLSDCEYRNLSCTQVYRDFVELPSQIMENWLYEPESLALYAKHHQTGAPLPLDMIEKIKASANFHSGINFLRQLNFATLDMSWYDKDPSEIENVREFERKVTENTTLIPTDKSEGLLSNTFAHIFASAYAAGYYSYKWAEVLDKDAFTMFKEQGIFNKEIAESFRMNILSKGGSENPMDLYLRFRGSEPKPESLLKHYNII